MYRNALTPDILDSFIINESYWNRALNSEAYALSDIERTKIQRGKYFRNTIRNSERVRK